MSVAEEIRSLPINDEFRSCPVCGYDMGFHISFLSEPDKPLRLILICPDCGARYDVGWRTELPAP